MIRFACPQCRKGFQVEDKLAGRKTKCPKCNGAISIPLAPACHPSVPATPSAAPNAPPPSPVSPHRPIPGAPAAVAVRGGAADGGQPGSAQSSPRSAATGDPPSGRSSEMKLVIGVCGAFSILVLGFLTWFFAIRGAVDIKGHIKGGAWLTRTVGSSEALQGLEIYVLRSPGKNSQLQAMLQAALPANKRRLMNEDHVAVLEAQARELSELIRSTTESVRRNESMPEFQHEGSAKIRNTSRKLQTNQRRA